MGLSVEGANSEEGKEGEASEERGGQEREMEAELGSVESLVSSHRTAMIRVR